MQFNGIILVERVHIRAKWPIQPALFSGFSSMKRLGVFLLPPGRDASEHRRVTPSIKFAGTHLYTWVERGTVSLAQEHNTMSPARLEPAPLDPEASALTMRAPHLTVLNIGTQQDKYDVTTEN